MKSDTITTFLNWTLAVFAVLGVYFTFMGILKQRELRSIQPQAMQTSQQFMLVQALVTDVSAYNQQVKSPEIARMLQAFQTQVAAIK